MKVVLEHGADSPGVAWSWRQSFRSVQDLDPSVTASPAPRGYVRRFPSVISGATVFDQVKGQHSHVAALPSAEMLLSFSSWT